MAALGLSGQAFRERAKWWVVTVILGYCYNGYCDKLPTVTVFKKPKRSKMAILYYKIIGLCDIHLLLQFPLVPTGSR